MFCTKCGTEIVENARFCSSCGNVVKQEMTIVSRPKRKVDFWGMVNVITLLILIVVGSVILYFLCNTENIDLDAGTASDNISSELSHLVGEFNLYGNTNANLANGGWVAEQGDWNYYAIKDGIFKENVITGEKIEILDTFDESGDREFRNLHVVGEYIYFSRWGANGICRVRIDGSWFEEFQCEWSDSIVSWDTWGANLYAVIKVPVSASQYREVLVQIHWDLGTYTEIAEVNTSEDINNYYSSYMEYKSPWKLVGTEVNKAFFCREDQIKVGPLNYDRAYYFLAIDLETGERVISKWIDNENLHYVSRIYTQYGVILFTHETRDGEFRLYYSDLCNGSTSFDYSTVPREASVLNFGGYVDDIIIGGDKITRRMDDGTEELIVADSATQLCVAHDKIYYIYEDAYYQINFDGTEWQEIDTNDFLWEVPAKWTE